MQRPPNPLPSGYVSIDHQWIPGKNDRGRRFNKTLFQNITSFIKFFVEQTQRAKNVKYGYISFNSIQHDVSPGLKGLEDFLTFLNTTKYTNGYTNYTT